MGCMLPYIAYMDPMGIGIIFYKILLSKRFGR